MSCESPFYICILGKKFKNFSCFFKISINGAFIKIYHTCFIRHVFVFGIFIRLIIIW